MNKENELSLEETVPKVPWTINDAIVAMILFIFVVTGGSFIISVALSAVFPKYGPAITLFIGYVILFALIWYLAIIKRGASWSSLGFRPFNVLRGLGLVVAWFFLVKIITAIYALIAQSFGFEQPPEMYERLPQIFGRGTLGFLIAVVAVAVIAPVIEELFFRGFIYPAFRERWGVVSAAIVSSLLFSLFHFSLFLFVPIAIIGLALAYLYEKTDSLGPPIILHALNNFLSLVLIYYSGILPVSG